MCYIVLYKPSIPEIDIMEPLTIKYSDNPPIIEFRVQSGTKGR